MLLFLLLLLFKGVFYLLQRVLDVFIICWFICGNYWVFNTDLNALLVNELNNTNSTNNVSVLAAPALSNNQTLTTSPVVVAPPSRDVKEVLSAFFLASLNKQDNESSKKDLAADKSLICYNTAYVHILAVYATIGLAVVLAISFQLYLLVKSTGERKSPKVSNHRTQRRQRHVDASASSSLSKS